MPKKNTSGGGIVKTNQIQKSPYNNGTTRATFANQPNEEDWEYNGTKYQGFKAHQCTAQSRNRICNACNTHFSTKKVCPECGSTDYTVLRCRNRAELEKATCLAHGAGKVMTKEHSDKCVASLMKLGFGITGVLFCTNTCPVADTCPYKGVLVDIERYGSSVPRCLPEQEMHDVIIERFKNEYELDDVADQVMLNRLAVSIVRLLRGEKILDAYGELVDRVRTSPDGSFETWQEINPISKSVDALDKRVQAWLKELAVSKAAREGRRIQISGNINLTSLLSDPAHATIISDDQVIDVDLDD
jgi:hypothetical protein